MGSFRDKNGKLEYRFSFKDPYGKIIRKSVTGLSREECLAKYEAYMREQSLPFAACNHNITIPVILKEVINNDYGMNYIKEATYSLYLEILEIVNSGKLRNIPVSHVTGEILEQFMMSLTDRYADSTIQKVHRQLKLAMDVAVDRELIDENPMNRTDFRRPRSSRKKMEVRAFTPEEQKQFLDVLMNYKVPRGRNNYKNQLLISLYSGLRMGEINALTPKSIDLKKKIIHVRSTVSHGLDNRIYLSDGAKTDEGMRDVPISRRLVPVFKDILKEKSANPLGLLFYDQNKDDAITTKQVNNFFRRVLEKARLPVSGQHTLRHTFATRCVEAGVNVSVLSKWLGHTNIHITLDTYTDVFARMNDESIEKLEVRMKVKEQEFIYKAA